MTPYLVDSNVIIDVITEDARFLDWSSNAIAASARLFRDDDAGNRFNAGEGVEGRRADGEHVRRAAHHPMAEARVIPDASCQMQLFADHSPQIGLKVPRRDHAAQRAVNQRLVSTIPGQRLEVLDDGRVQHDVDAKLGDARAPPLATRRGKPVSGQLAAGRGQSRPESVSVHRHQKYPAFL